MWAKYIYRFVGLKLVEILLNEVIGILFYIII